MQGPQGIEGTGRLLSRCPSTFKLALLLSSFNLWRCIYVGRSCWRINTVAQGCWVATGLSRRMGCSDPQGSGRGRESINPSKMKLCPGCHNPFASSKLYKLFAVFFAFGLWLIWYSWIQSVEVLPLNFFVRQKWYVGILGKTCCSRKTKENQQQRETKTQKYTNNKTRKPIHQYTNKTIKT